MYPKRIGWCDFLGGGEGCNGVGCCCFKILRKFFDEALSWPGAGFSEGADGATGDVVSNGEEGARVRWDTLSAKHAGCDFGHPEATFAAWSALSATFVSIEEVEVVESPEHVAGVVEDNDSTAADHGSSSGEV